MCGFVVNVNELITVQNKVYRKPTVIIANKVSGEEEIPDGAAAVLTSDMPDVLAHVSIRARNSKAWCQCILIFESYLIESLSAFICFDVLLFP